MGLVEWKKIQKSEKNWEVGVKPQLFSVLFSYLQMFSKK